MRPITGWSVKNAAISERQNRMRRQGKRTLPAIGSSVEYADMFQSVVKIQTFIGILMKIITGRIVLLVDRRSLPSISMAKIRSVKSAGTVGLLSLRPLRTDRRIWFPKTEKKPHE